MAVSTCVSPAKEVDVTKPVVSKSQASTTKPTKSKKKSLLKELKADAKAFHTELEGGLRGADAEIEAGLRAIGKMLRFKKKGKGKDETKNVVSKKVYSKTESDSPASDAASEASKNANDKPASSRNLSDFDAEVVESPKMVEKDEKLDVEEEKTSDVAEEKTSDVEEEKTSDVAEEKTSDVEEEKTSDVVDEIPVDSVVGEPEIVVEAEESRPLVENDAFPDLPAKMDEEEEIVEVERSVEEIVAEAEKSAVSKSNTSTYLTAGAVVVLAATPLLFMRNRK